jgi:pimeloyl-ACP methyl ester carboxylesterase
MSTVASHSLHRAAVDGLELAYEQCGTGDPVVLIHWGVCSAWGEPLMQAPVLVDRHRLLRYHRAGFAGSDRVEGPLSMAVHARHCADLMRRLGIERAHVVGHSSSAVVALQLALDAPQIVASLTLMEPARPAPSTELGAAFLRDVVTPAVGAYRAGDRAGAVDAWFRGVFGSDPRGRLERALPGVVDRAIAEADAFFGQELPALQAWSFTADDARKIEQPVLAVLGARTAPTFRERLDLLASWLPNVEAFVLPEASHLLHLENPRGMAEAMASFYGRHPA